LARLVSPERTSGTTIARLKANAAAPAAPGLTRQRVADLIAVLEKDRAKVVDLVNLTGHEFGLRPQLWTKWLERTSDQQLEKTERKAR
jgi:hypothetical protein